MLLREALKKEAVTLSSKYGKAQKVEEAKKHEEQKGRYDEGEL